VVDIMEGGLESLQIPPKPCLLKKEITNIDKRQSCVISFTVGRVIYTAYVHTNVTTDLELIMQMRYSRRKYDILEDFKQSHADM
jgi:hypothetical protein